jgi:hypothetical protein
MGFRNYVIKHGKEDVWLTQIIADGHEKVYRYLPDIGMAMKIETVTEARRIAKACRGRVQAFRMSRSGEPYGEDVD